MRASAVLRRPLRRAFSTAPPPAPAPLSDHEWELQTGRAIYILTQTLPAFFDTGLVDRADLAHAIADDERSIYAPHVRLEYTPPRALPAPFPRTLWAQGLPLYIASSVFLRHSLRALYTSLHVAPTRARVAAPAGPRSKALLLGLKVSGLARVSGAPAEWHVNSTYTFAPASGRVERHVVDSIEPAPHAHVYDALLGLVGGAPAPAPVPGPVPAHVPAESARKE